MRVRALAALAAAAVMAAACGKKAGLGAAEPGVIRIEAKKFAYTPDTVTLKRGQPTVLELVSVDRKHGFKVDDLNLRADVVPGKPARVTLTPEKSGTYPFRCDLFCGTGHEGMRGKIVVVD